MIKKMRDEGQKSDRQDKDSNKSGDVVAPQQVTQFRA